MSYLITLALLSPSALVLTIALRRFVRASRAARLERAFARYARRSA